MQIVADRAAVEKLMAAEARARELAAIHWATCRARRQGLVCSTCVELNSRKRRAAQALGEVR